MAKFVRVARVYPAVLGILPVCVLLAICAHNWLPQYQVYLGRVKWLLCLIGGTAIVSAAVGYLISELFRETSKHLFQYPIFKMDETEMPTTKMLLWQTGAISDGYHKEIAKQVKASFGIKLPSKEEERANLIEAKKTIVDVVAQIRQSARDDEVLMQYNMEFSFCRNYLGASVWSLLAILVLMIINITTAWLPWPALIITLLIQSLLMLGFYLLLKRRGWVYARYLFATFTKGYN